MTAGKSGWPKTKVEIIERRTWELGGRSVYFRDPDGHLLELGYQMAGRVQALLGDAWTEVEITNDLAGIPRVLAARKK